MKVFKFGGASVKDPSAVRNVSNILSLYKGEKITVVVSAMGKTTNKLEEIFKAYVAGDRKSFMSLVDNLYAFHEEILGVLFPEKHFGVFNSIEDIFENLHNQFNEPFSGNYSFAYDQIVSLGEIISSHIIAAFLSEQGYSVAWADARKLIRTNSNFQEGEVHWEKTEELIQTLKLLIEVINQVKASNHEFSALKTERFEKEIQRFDLVSDYNAAMKNIAMPYESLVPFNNAAKRLSDASMQKS